MNEWHGAVVRLWSSETSRAEGDFLGTAFIAGGSLDGLTARKGPVDMVLIEDE